MHKVNFNIVIVGSGNMANALGNLFAPYHTISQIVSRNKKTGSKLAKHLKCSYNTSLKDAYTNADFYFLCVPDDSIKPVSKQLSHVKGILVHHSGSKPLTEITHKNNRAVLYPFTSVHPNTNLNTVTTPLFVNTEGKTNTFLLQKLTEGLNVTLSPISDKDRLTLHLAAVLVNNFTNHLYHKAQQLTKHIPNAQPLLANLAEQALNNLKSDQTKQNQTGPARRKDKTTQNAHIKLIKTDSDLRKTYVHLSKSITKTYSHE